MRTILWLVIPTVLSMSGAARGEGDTMKSPTPPEGPRTYFHMRVGASSGNRTDRPEVCAEVAPHRRFSVQACGTGSDLWHNDPAPQLSHYRVDWHILAAPLGGGVVEPLLGVGFAELQVGRDDPGFRFGGTGSRNVETAGPEVATSLRWVKPLDTTFNFIADMNIGAAWLPHANELVVPQSRVQAFVAIGAGVGF
jgi:hypothetical protein